MPQSAKKPDASVFSAVASQKNANPAQRMLKGMWNASAGRRTIPPRGEPDQSSRSSGAFDNRVAVSDVIRPWLTDSFGHSPECPNGKASRDESSYGGCPQRDFYPGDHHAPTENEPNKLDAREQEEKKSRDKDVSTHQSSGLGSATILQRALRTDARAQTARIFSASRAV